MAENANRRQEDGIRRAQLFEEQRGLCFYCDAPMSPPPFARPRSLRDVTLEHLIPLSEGGRRAFPNEVAACNECNHRRGTMPWLLFFCLKELERAGFAQEGRPIIRNCSVMPGGRTMNASTDTAGTERKRVSALPFLLPYAREIRRAVAGDVPGLPDLKPLSFPKRPRARQRLLRGMSSFVAAAQRSTEEERIRFARKLAVHIIRDNWQPFGSDIMLGVHWFAANRNALSSRLSLSGAVRLQKIKRKRDLEHQMQMALARWHADMQAPDVPMPVILSHGGHQLTELTTARHLVEIGIEAGNCLARRVGTTNVPHDSYWNQMRTGTRHIFALRRGGDLIAVFSIASPDHGEIQFLIPRASVIAILKRCAPAVVAATGHSVPHIFHRWVSDDEAPPLHATPTPSNDNAREEG